MGTFNLLDMVVHIADIFYFFFVFIGKCALTPLSELLGDGFSVSVISPFSNTVFSSITWGPQFVADMLIEFLEFFDFGSFNLADMNLLTLLLFVVALTFIVRVLWSIINIVVDIVN